ncbi:hypothetical protein [Brevundimonas sp. TWP3-1-2b1]|uniref:hypothetical protein n=1 Tax=Brevundimonas sp. TWP3-1-2b1 TaxID=2804650 RepID=UPI003CEA2AC2
MTRDDLRRSIVFHIEIDAGQAVVSGDNIPDGSARSPGSSRDRLKVRPSLWIIDLGWTASGIERLFIRSAETPLWSSPHLQRQPLPVIGGGVPFGTGGLRL